MQGELFSLKNAGPVVDASKLNPPQPNWLDRLRFTLRLDHLAIIAISGLVLYVLVFSFGVEKGKRIALKEIRAAKVKQRQVAQELLKSQSLRESFPPPTQAPSSHAPSEDGVRLASPPPAIPVQPSVSVSGKYTIQLITFTSRARAEEEAKKLKGKGLQGFVIPAGKFFHVCVDNFEKMNEAKEKLFKLKQQGSAPPDAYIRPMSAHVPF